MLVGEKECALVISSDHESDTKDSHSGEHDIYADPHDKHTHRLSC